MKTVASVLSTILALPISGGKREKGERRKKYKKKEERKYEERLERNVIVEGVDR